MRTVSFAMNRQTRAMFRYLLSLFVCVQVACCPIFCRALSALSTVCEGPVATSASSGPHSSRGAACPHCCRLRSCQTDHEPDSSAPVQRCPCHGNGHTCICSGAIVEKTESDQLTQVQSFVCVTPATISLTHLTAAPARPAHTDALPPFGGRAMRTLLCSLLC